MSKKVPLTFYAVYVMCLVLFFVAGTEIVSRLLFRGQDSEVSTSNEQLVYDPVVGWRARRGLEGNVAHPPHPVPIHVTINANGFRDEDWTRKLERADVSGAKKVLLIGDSMVYGWGSEADSRLGEQLAAIYRVHDERAEVFNGGIPAFGPPQQLRLLPELLQYIDPDVVVVLFFENDYGDTALPYHHKYPFRVYKPFYDEQAQLVLNERVPKRPSLRMKETIIGNLRLWQAADAFYYFLQDRQYAAYGIPDPRTAAAIYPLRAYDGFVWEEYLKEQYPYVERTVMAIYEKMHRLSRAHGAKFFVASATERVNYAIERPIGQRGVPFIPGPKEERRYSRWDKVFRDLDHGNFLWAWIIAGKAYEAIEGKAFVNDFRDLPQLRSIATELDLGDERGSVRYLSAGWGLRNDGGRWLGTDGAFMLRNPDVTARTLTLEVTGHAGTSRIVTVTNDRDEVLCTLLLSETVGTSACRFAAPSEPILFLNASATGAVRATQHGKGQEKQDAANVFVRRLGVRRAD